MITFQREVPFWQALQQTFRHYGTEGWGVVFPSIPRLDVTSKEEWVPLERGRFESRVTTVTPNGVLTIRSLFDPREPAWCIERPIKVFGRDWPAYRASAFGVVEQADWSQVQHALDAVGEDYLLEVWLGAPFFDFIAGGREGGLQQGIFDLMEHEAFFEKLHEVYTDYLLRLTHAACAHTSAESVVLGCAWSCVSCIGPNIWRRWDLPVIRAVAAEAHAAGKLLHVHFHGKCRDVLADLAGCGADCFCPFERPPGGDVTDLSEVRHILGDRVTVNGNIHTVETLIRGSVDDVRREVEEIFMQWGEGRRRLILGTGDQVGAETPEENIIALVQAGRELGRGATVSGTECGW